MKNIFLIEGDITKADVDVIVNAANPKMLGGGGVDGAIHKAAGSILLEECRKVNPINGIRCPFGEARITGSGNLKSKYVVHTTGPIYGQTNDPAYLLKSAYINSLNLALEHDCNSIAFPAISCGAYGYPVSEAAKISIEVCGMGKYSELKIYFYLFNSKLVNKWKVAVENFQITKRSS